MKREKRHQAAGPEGGFFEAFSFFFGRRADTARLHRLRAGGALRCLCWGYLPQRARGSERAAHWRLFCFLRRAYYLAKMRSMRRNGSAAPHSNWSPTVKAER